MLKRIALCMLMALPMGGCLPSLPKTPGEQAFVNDNGFGYIPLDPLPVTMRDGFEQEISANRLKWLPDETVRLAIGEFNASGELTFGPAKLGTKGGRYVVVLDYIKFDTRPLCYEVAKQTVAEVENEPALSGQSRHALAQAMSQRSALLEWSADDSKNPEKFVVPAYVGVGLRLTATVDVLENDVDLGNLFALGVKAESNLVRGTLVVQSMGLSGEEITPLLPMPNKIDQTTIANAITALSNVRIKLYSDKTQVNPRIVGIYNTVPGGQAKVNQMISLMLDERKQRISMPDKQFKPSSNGSRPIAANKASESSPPPAAESKAPTTKNNQQGS
jgi:hypothetical protein